MGRSFPMKLSAGVLLLAATSAPAQESLTVSGKAAVFGRRLADPASFANSALGAGLNQWQDDPVEWGQGMQGYSRRYALKLANRGAENGIGFAAAVALGEDPRYFPCHEAGVWRRTRHALVSTFLTRTDDGGRRPALWRFAGNYGAQFISNSWRPPSHHGVQNALVRGSLSIGFDAAANVFKEFWPDIKRKVLKK